MSTYWYFQCLSHKPTVKDNKEVSQHTNDALYLEAIRLANARPLGNGPDRYDVESNNESWMTKNAKQFLNAHPNCQVNLINEYKEVVNLPFMGKDVNAEVTVHCLECMGLSGHRFTCSQRASNYPGYQIEISGHNPKDYINNIVKKAEELLSKKPDLRSQIKAELSHLPNLDNYTDAELDALMSAEDFDSDNFNWKAFWERMRRHPAGPKTKKRSKVDMTNINNMINSGIEIANTLVCVECGSLPGFHSFKCSLRKPESKVSGSITNVEVGPSSHIVHPTHYNQGKIEVWDFIVDQNLNFLLGSVIKYVCRAGKKNTSLTIQDLRKAREFLDKEIESETKQMKAKNLKTYKDEAGL